jgi:hypothetical protein
MNLQPMIDSIVAGVEELERELVQMTAWRDAARRDCDENEGMAGCMDLLRRDLIEAKVIGESVPPMFMTEAILRAVQVRDAAVKDAERYRWLCEHGSCPFAETDDAWEIGNLNAAIDAAMADRLRVCPSCNVGEKQGPHTCPFKSDIGGNDEKLCECCLECKHQCAMAI